MAPVKRCSGVAVILSVPVTRGMARETQSLTPPRPTQLACALSPGDRVIPGHLIFSEAPAWVAGWTERKLG